MALRRHDCAACLAGVAHCARAGRGILAARVPARLARGRVTGTAISTLKYAHSDIHSVPVVRVIDRAQWCVLSSTRGYGTLGACE